MFFPRSISLLFIENTRKNLIVQYVLTGDFNRLCQLFDPFNILYWQGFVSNSIGLSCPGSSDQVGIPSQYRPTDPESLRLTASPGHIGRHFDVFKDSPDVVPWHGDVIDKHVIAPSNVF